MNVFVDSKAYDKFLRAKDNAIRTGISRAINKTATKTKTKITKSIGQDVNLPAKYIKDKLSIYKSNKNKLIAKISANKRGIQLRRFFVKQLVKKGKTVQEKPGGIRVKVKKKGRSKDIKNAFLIKLKNNNGYGIAYRKPGAKGRNNYDILYAPSVSQIFQTIIDGKKYRTIEYEVMKDFEKLSSHEINYALSKI